MKAFSFYLLLGVLFSRTDAAEQKHIDEACSDVWGVINCDSSITYPNYPRPVNGRIPQLPALSQLTSMIQTSMVYRLIQKLCLKK